MDTYIILLSWRAGGQTYAGKGSPRLCYEIGRAEVFEEEEARRHACGWLGNEGVIGVQLLLHTSEAPF